MTEEAPGSTDEEQDPPSPDPSSPVPSSPAPTPADESRKGSPAQKVSRLVLVLIAVIFAWHLFADRITPYSGVAWVQLFYVSVTPQVSGYIIEVPVALDDVVEEGDVIARINPHPFELAVHSAEAQLDLAGQNLRAASAGITSALSALAVTRTELDNAERNLDRAEAIRATDPGAIALFDYDALLAARNGARSQVARAEADVESAREQMGVEGADNPAIRAAVATLDTARFNLEMTIIRAPRHGRVADLRLTEGKFASTGQPMATLVVDKDAWLRAPMRENNLSRLEAGQRVEIVLDGAPGRIFHGRVASIGLGVSQGQAPLGELPDESNATGWFSAPQQYPVIIRLPADTPRELLRAGAKASVTVYTGDHPFLNSVAWFLIRVASYVAYLN